LVGSKPVAWTTKGNLETLASTPKEARYMWGLPSGSTISVPLYASPQAPAEHVVGADRLIEAAKDVIVSASDTYKKRNGHLGSFEDDSGEKCWIVPFDAFEGLRSAVDALASTKVGR
jgi:hypothetical protein